MDKEYTRRLIYEYNPRLAGKEHDIPSFKRRLYAEISRWLPKKQIIAVTGLRRVGKTTLMLQLMQQLPNAVFFSFDEEEMQTKETLVYVIDFSTNNLKAQYIFLDELQYVKDWQGVLKRYYDTKNIKFIVSGSESLEITKAKESLAGRLVSFRLDTLSFSEFLGLKGKKLQEIRYDALLTEKEFFEFEFLDYLYKGAFPELVNEKDEEQIMRHMNESVVKKIIYRDIPRIFDIKRRDLLFSLFKYACDNSSNLFEIKNICNTFKADYETVNNYLFYLQKSFLIDISEVYSKSMAKRARRNKKIYVVHPSIAFALLGYRKDMLIEKILGQYVESLFHSEFFWRDKHKNEVDIVMQTSPIKPIEVKYKNSITKGDLKGLLRFLDVFKLKNGLVITKDIFKIENIDNKSIEFIPAWYFSLSV